MAKAFKIGNVLDSVMETANNIASKAKSVDYNGIYTDIKEAVKQTDEELADVARATLINSITGDTKVPASRIQEIAKNTGITDAGFNRKVRDLTSAMKKQDLSEAHKIAGEIDREFQTGQKTFQDLVIQADIGINNTLQSMRNADPAMIKGAWTSQFMKNNIPEPVKNFTTTKNRETIANVAYRAQGTKKYFATDDPSVNQKRLGVVAGGYVAATSGMRIINGGTPLTNEYGERDIAGIPFI
jgi:hypothetical protein